MKIFLSWSGEPSRTVALSLREWLGLVAQHVDPWMSDEEIRSGTRWNESIAISLDQTDFGIVCVTRTNQSSPWLMFEAGALAKRLETARVIPLCIDLTPSDITSPLQAFQARVLDRDGMRRLVHELNELANQPRLRESIDKLFDAMWPDLEQAIKNAMVNRTDSATPRRSTEDMLSELVTRVREIERTVRIFDPQHSLLQHPRANVVVSQELLDELARMAMEYDPASRHTSHSEMSRRDLQEELDRLIKVMSKMEHFDQARKDDLVRNRVESIRKHLDRDSIRPETIRPRESRHTRPQSPTNPPSDGEG